MQADTNAPAQLRSSRGFETLIDVAVAPLEAFRRLQQVPTWGWALIFLLVASTIGALLTAPAMEHAVRTDAPRLFAHYSGYSSLAPQEQQQMIDRAAKFARLSSFTTPILFLLVILLQSGVLALVGLFAGVGAQFSRMWALALNVGAIVFGIEHVLQGIICIVRGPNAFMQSIEINTALPSLAMLAPHAGPKVIALLAAMNPFYLWGALLLGIGFHIVGRVPKWLGYTTSVGLWLTGAALAVMSAH